MLRVLRVIAISGGLSALAAGMSGCQPNRRFAELMRENQALREESQQARQQVRTCENDLIVARGQLQSVEGLGPDRPADLFAPVSIEIASLSGGADYDGKPGDDGVTVHLRPKDADGAVVKAPGRITVQLLDNTDMASPRVVAVCRYEDPQELRMLWMGIFGTNHYTLRCEFPEGSILPKTQRLLVGVSFVDYLTGRTLTAGKEVTFSLGEAAP
jgi:hypothetical protein